MDASSRARAGDLVGVHNVQRAFAHHGAAEIEAFLTAAEFDAMRRHVERKLRERQFRSMDGDNQVAGAPCDYADPDAELLLARKAPYLSDLLQLDLVPTYSFLRLYRPGDRLAAHRDRPACEITVSASLAADSRWPLSMLLATGVVDFTPAPRAAVVFRGIDLLHWRDPLSGDNSIVQIFLHYVDRNGPHRSWEHDRRRKATEAAG